MTADRHRPGRALYLALEGGNAAHSLLMEGAPDAVAGGPG